MNTPEKKLGGMKRTLSGLYGNVAPPMPQSKRRKIKQVSFGTDPSETEYRAEKAQRLAALIIQIKSRITEKIQTDSVKMARIVEKFKALNHPELTKAKKLCYTVKCSFLKYSEMFLSITAVNGNPDKDINCCTLQNAYNDANRALNEFCKESLNSTAKA